MIVVAVISVMSVPLMSLLAVRGRVIMSISILVIVRVYVPRVMMCSIFAIVGVHAGLAGVTQIPQVVFAPGFTSVGVAMRLLVRVDDPSIGNESVSTVQHGR